jgi:hypothetical protein
MLTIKRFNVQLLDGQFANSKEIARESARIVEHLALFFRIAQAARDAGR